MPNHPQKPLQRIGEVCRSESVSPRTLAGRLSLDVPTAKQLRKPTTDMRLSDLYLVAQAIGVPAAELLQDADASEGQRLLGTLVRIAKLVNALIETFSINCSQRIIAESIKAIIDEEFPSDEIQAMHTTGVRRSADELGRAATAITPGVLDTHWVNHPALMEGR